MLEPMDDGQQREGGRALLVSHSAVFGRRERLVRKFSVGPVQPYAQYPSSVSIMFTEPRKRVEYRYIERPDNLDYTTVEVDGRTVYDSRRDVPCDMAAWERTRRWFKDNPAIMVTRSEDRPC